MVERREALVVRGLQVKADALTFADCILSLCCRRKKNRGKGEGGGGGRGGGGGGGRGGAIKNLQPSKRINFIPTRSYVSG